MGQVLEGPFRHYATKDVVNETAAPVTFTGDLINRLRRKINVRVTAAPIRDTGGLSPFGCLTTGLLRVHYRGGFGGDHVWTQP